MSCAPKQAIALLLDLVIIHLMFLRMLIWMQTNYPYCLSNHEGKVSPFSVSVKDTTGAGDAFVAGFIHQLCQRRISSLKDPLQIKEIITYACAVGALTTLKPGAIAAQPTPEEVEIFLKHLILVYTTKFLLPFTCRLFNHYHRLT